MFWTCYSDLYKYKLAVGFVHCLASSTATKINDNDNLSQQKFESSHKGGYRIERAVGTL